MAVKVEGKTINQLVRVDEVTGSEILAMSVYDEEAGAYVTRGITVDNFMQLIYDKFHEMDERMNASDEMVASYVASLEEADESIREEEVRLNNEIQKTNSYVSYNAEGIITVHNEVRQHWSYVQNSYSYVEWQIAQLSSYSYDSIAGLVGYTNSIGQRTDAMVAYENSLGEMIDNANEQMILIGGQIDTLGEDLISLGSYAYEGLAKAHTDNERQDVEIAENADNIAGLARGLAYQTMVNNIQSSYINTIYYEGSDDAFDDYGIPGDENVKPQP